MGTMETTEESIEAVFEESNEGELPTQRSAFDDIRAFEQVMRNPLTFEEQGLLAIRYRNCLASAFGTKSDPIRTESLLLNCAAVSRMMFTRVTGLPSLINPVEGLFMLNDSDLKKKIKKTNSRLIKNEKKNVKKDKEEKKDKKKKDKKLSKKEKKKLKKMEKKLKKGKKGKKDKKKKKGKKDKKKDKKKKDKKKDKKEKEEKPEKEESFTDLRPLSISDQFEKFALIADYLSRSDSSISRYVPCLKFTESTSIPQTEQEKEECNELRKAAEFQYRSEECWRSYLTQVRHCRYSNNPGACAASFSGLEAECSLYGLEAHSAIQTILHKE